MTELPFTNSKASSFDVSDSVAVEMKLLEVVRFILKSNTESKTEVASYIFRNNHATSEKILCFKRILTNHLKRMHKGHPNFELLK